MIKIFSKKSFAILIALMLVLQIFVPVSAVQIYYCSDCHNNGVKGELKYTIAPTCGEPGFNIYECEYVHEEKNCPGSITIRVEPNNEHTPDGKVVEEIPATCTENGTKAYEGCINCDAKLEPGTANELIDIVIPATGHDYETEVIAPDCTNGGFTKYVCSVCEDTYTDNVTEAHGHDFSVEIPEVPATCREEGTSAYVKCSFCETIDPENPKKVLPVEDHNGKFVDSKEETCLQDGYNIFKCEKEGCPYYEGVTEVINKFEGHDIKKIDVVDATCTEDGCQAYEVCTRCDYSTYNDSLIIEALGHTEVNVGYVAATCTEEGMTNAIVCDRCGFVHHEGEVISATGHILTAIDAVDATCETAGNVAHKKCEVCEKLFEATVENGDPTATPITNVAVEALGHDYHVWTDEPTCVENGHTIYTCTRPLAAGGECQHTYSEIISATGHDFEAVEKVEPKCGVEGKEAHNKCKVCELLFAASTDEADITAQPVPEADLAIEALEHVEKVVEAKNPTYDADGNEAGKVCELCGEELVGAKEIAELEETVKFWYDVKGVNNSADAVNSGYVKLEVYFDVLASADDLEEYNSDVLANLFAVDFAMNFDKDAFTLTNVEVAPGAFAKAAFTELSTANTNGNISITQDMVNTYKTFRGTNNLFATLTFQVNKEAVSGNYNFECTNLLLVHPESEEINTAYSQEGVEIAVKNLGDANGDGIFTSADSLIVSEYIKDTNIEKIYIAEYDLDKDGDIDFIDLDLLRNAITGNNYFLDITVDPNVAVE